MGTKKTLTKGKYLVVKHNGEIKKVKKLDKKSVIFLADGVECEEKTKSKLTADENKKLK